MKYSPFRHLGSVFWKRRPVHFTFFVTKRCNARCAFCFYSFGKKPSSGPSSELSLAEIEKISSSLGNLLWLALSGGEVFLRDDLVEIVRVFYRQNKPAMILLPTNGLRPGVVGEMTEAVLAQCPKSTVVVKLSLDGPEELHDSMRGVPGAFRKTMETYEGLKGLLGTYRNFELGVNTVFCARNQGQMDRIREVVRGLEQVRTHTVSLIRGEVADRALQDVDPALYLEVIAEMESSLRRGRSPVYRFRGARLKAAQDILQRRLIHRTLLEKKRLIPCFAGRLNLVLTEAGKLYPCESFTYPMGDVREMGYDVGRVLRSERGRKVVDGIRKGGCYCTHECNFMTNILFHSSQYPALLREYLQLRLV